MRQEAAKPGQNRGQKTKSKHENPAENAGFGARRSHPVHISVPLKEIFDRLGRQRLRRETKKL